MPTDAKLGLLVGLGGVLAVALVFFQKEPPAAPAEAVATTKSPVPVVKSPAEPKVQVIPVSRTSGRDG